jgi:hypothetical protein
MEEAPFRYLTSEEFLKLKKEERAAYLQRVTDHFAELAKHTAKEKGADTPC